jgi:hypothetical protein
VVRASPDAGPTKLDAEGSHAGDARLAPDSARRDARTMDASPADSTSCAPPFRLCGASCVDLTSDIHHCGDCAVDCAGLAHVDTGSVSCTLGACDFACSPGYANCGDAGDGCITSLSSSAACGSCSTQCTGDTPACATVTDGGMACASGCAAKVDALCDGVCVNSLADPNNCGACGTTCVGGPCTDGQCTCPTGKTLSGGVCCPPGQSGINGMCCAPGLVACAGVCVDEQTDPNNCGSCTTSCNAGCQSARCITELAEDPDGPGALAVDATHVYWLTNKGDLKSIPLAGGSVTTLTSDANTGGAIAVDTTSVYFDSDSLNTIAKIPKQGGSPSTFFPGAAETQMAWPTILVESNEVYWSTGSISGSVLASPTSGGSVSTIVSGEPVVDGLAVDETNVYFSIQEGTVSAVSNDGFILSVPRAGGALVTLTATDFFTTVMAVQGGTLYWADDHGDFFTLPITGGTPSTFVGPEAAAAIATDSANLYWVDLITTAVERIGLTGGAVTPLAPTTASPVAIVVDDTSVYWTQDHAVMKVTPK